jgi:hypothetical protein
MVRFGSWTGGLGCGLTDETVELDGVVEFKSLPSGLHNVPEDLVYVLSSTVEILCHAKGSFCRYFVHDQYAGLSAFVNEPDAQSERNALLLAVGVLVPLSYGRLGKSWRHATGLKELARYAYEDGLWSFGKC